MSPSHILLLEPDARRAAAVRRRLESLRFPVTTVATTDALAEAAAATGCHVVAVSGLGGGVAARVRSVREDLRTASMAVIALVPPGGTGVTAIRAGADDVLTWPCHESLLRNRFRSVLAATRSFAESQRAATAFARILEAVEAREPHRIEHSARVGRLAAEMARCAGLSAAEVERVRFGGVLHDFGTVAIPDGILYKTERLTDAEFALMRTHPVVGFSLLKEVPALEPYLPFVLRHHERVDGSGYPDGLRGPEIPLAVQFVSLSDAYDAMTSSRPYRPVRDDRETIRVLEEEARRGVWDPTLLPILVAAVAALEGQSGTP